MKRKLIKHTSSYRGSLMTFQHYLNTYSQVLPFEAMNDGGSQLYKISEWYDKGVLKQIVIELDKDFRESPTHYLNKKDTK